VNETQWYRKKTEIFYVPFILQILGRQLFSIISLIKLVVLPAKNAKIKGFTILNSAQAETTCSERHTMMALTMSFWLFFRARTAFARDTLACDITSSMSFASIPLSSTCDEHRHIN